MVAAWLAGADDAAHHSLFHVHAVLSIVDHDCSLVARQQVVPGEAKGTGQEKDQRAKYAL